MIFSIAADDHHHNDDDNDDISTGDYGYNKRLIILKIFCNILHVLKKILNFNFFSDQNTVWNMAKTQFEKYQKFEKIQKL